MALNDKETYTMEEQTTNFSFNATGISKINPLWTPQWALNVEIVYIFFVVIIGVPGNGLIILVHSKNNEKTSTDFYVLTMAVLEFISSSASAVLRIFVNTRIVWIAIASVQVCSLRQFVTTYTTQTAAYILAAIAVDRYIKTCRPLNTCYTTRRAKIVCVIIVTVSGVLCLPAKIGVYDVDEFYNCVFILETQARKKLFDMLLIFLNIVVYVVICVVYLKIAVSLRKRQTEKLKRVTADIGLTNQSAQKVSNKIYPATTTRSTIQQSGQTFEVSPQFNVSQQTDNNSAFSTSTKSKDQLRTERSTTSNSRFEALRLQESTVNRTTRMMFLITVVYVLTYLVPWIRVLAGPVGPVFDNFARSIFMINCITNPVLFYSMSSKFRKDVRKLLPCFLI